jgi:hypothetical protein
MNKITTEVGVESDRQLRFVDFGQDVLSFKSRILIERSFLKGEKVDDGKVFLNLSEAKELLNFLQYIFK